MRPIMFNHWLYVEGIVNPPGDEPKPEPVKQIASHALLSHRVRHPYWEAPEEGIGASEVDVDSPFAHVEATRHEKRRGRDLLREGVGRVGLALALIVRHLLFLDLLAHEVDVTHEV